MSECPYARESTHAGARLYTFLLAEILQISSTTKFCGHPI